MVGDTLVTPESGLFHSGEWVIPDRCIKMNLTFRSPQESCIPWSFHKKKC